MEARLPSTRKAAACAPRDVPIAPRIPPPPGGGRGPQLPMGDRVPSPSARTGRDPPRALGERSAASVRDGDRRPPMAPSQPARIRPRTQTGARTAARAPASERADLEAGDAVGLALQHLEAEAVEAEHLALGGDHLRLVDDQARDRVGLLVGQVPVGGTVEVADGHGAVHHELAVAGALELGGLGHVVLVGDLAHDLLQDVLQRDQALERAVLVHHQREVGVPAQELAHLVVERGGVGHEVGRHRHLGDHEGGQAVLLAGLGVEGVRGAQQVLGMHDADDVLLLASEHRQTGVARLEALGQDRPRLGVGVDHLDARAVEHDLLDRALAQIERAEDAVAVLLLDHALGMAELERALDLLAHREHVGVGVGADPEQAQDGAHQRAHGAHDRREHQHHDPDDRADEGRGGFRVGDGVGLGQHLGEDQHQQRHQQRRHRHAPVAEQPREERGGERGRQDVDEVVAEQHRADQALVVLRDAQRQRRALGAPVGARAQLAPRGRRQRRLGAREEGRQHQENQDREGGDPEGGVHGRTFRL